MAAKFLQWKFTLHASRWSTLMPLQAVVESHVAGLARISLSVLRSILYIQWGIPWRVLSMLGIYLLVYLSFTTRVFSAATFPRGPGGRDRTPSSPENLDCLSGNKMWISHSHEIYHYEAKQGHLSHGLHTMNCFFYPANWNQLKIF